MRPRRRDPRRAALPAADAEARRKAADALEAERRQRAAEAADARQRQIEIEEARRRKELADAAEAEARRRNEAEAEEKRRIAAAEEARRKEEVVAEERRREERRIAALEETRRAEEKRKEDERVRLAALPDDAARAEFVRKIQAVLKRSRCWDGALSGRSADAQAGLDTFVDTAKKRGKTMPARIELAKATVGDFETWLRDADAVKGRLVCPQAQCRDAREGKAASGGAGQRRRRRRRHLLGLPKPTGRGAAAIAKAGCSTTLPAPTAPAAGARRRQAGECASEPSANSWRSEQIDELFDREAGLIDDLTQRPPRDVFATVVGNNCPAGPIVAMLENPVATLGANDEGNPRVRGPA